MIPALLVDVEMVTAVTVVPRKYKTKSERRKIVVYVDFQGDAWNSDEMMHQRPRNN